MLLTKSLKFIYLFIHLNFCSRVELQIMIEYLGNEFQVNEL